MNPWTGVVAFLSEYLDSAMGMGYGTALVPVMLFMGYDPVVVIPAVLVSQLATDIVTFLLHHRARNVDMHFGSADLRCALTLGLMSAAGVIVAVLVALNIPKNILSIFVGIIVLAMGIVVAATAKRPFVFSWKKLVGVSLLAAFNKGISGGGYGPLVMGGQLLSGVDAKKAVGITAMAEAITCAVGFTMYLVQGQRMDWGLTGFLTLSAVAAVPFAVLTVKKTPSARLKKYVGILIAILGCLTLLKAYRG